MITKTLRHAAIAAAAFLVLPAAASAAVVDFGSDLSAPANVSEAHGADTAFWGLSVKGKNNSVPASGQIKVTLALTGIGAAYFDDIRIEPYQRGNVLAGRVR